MEFNVIQELLNYFNITVCTKECMPLNRITVVQKGDGNDGEPDARQKTEI